MTPEHLLVERDSSVLIITLNRPRVHNALNAALLGELDRAMADAANDHSIGAVLLTGAGEKAFAAGADLQELSGYTATEAREHARRVQEILLRIERLAIPVIVAVNGLAFGGGCELAMACTIRIAADTARFGQPEINLGIVPGYGGSQRLPRLVGRGRACEMLLTGNPISAGRAQEIGLVDRVVPAASLRGEALALAREIASKPRVARHYILDAVAAGVDLPAGEAQQHEAALFGLVFTTDDARALYETLKERGVTDFTQEPTDHFYGTDMGIRDPFGNAIRILERKTAPASATA